MYDSDESFDWFFAWLFRHPDFKITEGSPLLWNETHWIIENAEPLLILARKYFVSSLHNDVSVE